jgi:hypothetical protein
MQGQVNREVRTALSGLSPDGDAHLVIAEEVPVQALAVDLQIAREQACMDALGIEVLGLR